MIVQNGAQEHLWVFFPEDEKIGLPEVEKFARKMLAKEVKRGIIIIKKEMTNLAKKLFIFITYCYTFLLYN